MVNNSVVHHPTMVASSKVTMVRLLSSTREDNSNRVGMEDLPRADRRAKVHRKVKAGTTTAKGLNLSIKVTNFRGRPTIKVSLLIPQCACTFLRLSLPSVRLDRIPVPCECHLQPMLTWFIQEGHPLQLSTHTPEYRSLSAGNLYS